MARTWRTLAAFLRRVAGLLLLGFTGALSLPATAQVVADWGTVATPLTDPVTFTFSQSNVSGNFTHQYTFTLAGSADATYSVTFQFDACRNGCGNPVLSYGVNGAGPLSESPTGTYLLAPGTYTFEVTGTGMGAGNSVDYQGSLTFAAAEVVSPVPEPQTYLLLASGLAAVMLAVRRRRRRDAEHDGPAPRPSPALAASRPAALLLAAPLVLALAGCGSPSASGPTQVVARVGETDITALQLEFAARASRGPLGSDPDRGQVVEKLIDRELAVQQALAAKLDRQPEVMLRLEELRRDVLAAAYAERIAAARAKPSPQAVETFYAQHPELFAQRRVYRLRELVVAADSPHLAEVKQRLVQRQPPAEIAAWLARENARFGQQETLRSAEQVPLEALRRLHATPVGQVAVFDSQQAVIVYEVLGFQPAPLDLAAAAPRIAEHLARQQGDRAMREELKNLRAGSVIVRTAEPGTRSAATAIREGA